MERKNSVFLNGIKAHSQYCFNHLILCESNISCKENIYIYIYFNGGLVSVMRFIIQGNLVQFTVKLHSTAGAYLRSRV